MSGDEEPAGEGTGPLALSLSESELKVLVALRAAERALFTEAEVADRTSLPPDGVRGCLQRLRSKGLALVDEEHRTTPTLTRKGRDALERGLPERRLANLLASAPAGLGPSDVTAQGFSDEERSAAIGILRRRGAMAEGVPLRLRPDAAPGSLEFPEESCLRAASEGAPSAGESESFRNLQRRGLVGLDHTTTRRWTASEEGRALAIDASGAAAVGMLSAELLRHGEWRGRPFRPYDVRATVPFVHGARPHPYLEWLRDFEEILVGLGFEQAEGPLLETEFWNADVLYMPQNHPARSVHDMLSVEGLHGQLPPAELLDRVAAVHEGRPLAPGGDPLGPGWRAPYDRSRAGRPVARSQTTAVSARYLAQRPPPPFRMYSIDRNFRRESVDATHHIEFGQCEGVLGEEGINLRHLVGVFRAVAEALHLPELKFRPSYFPFTEPSIEGYARHPSLGWIEVFPGGILRPEVTRPLAVDVPVAAWGIGITRLAMVSLGVSDIRDLFLDDLSRLTSGPG